ncbi:MAG: hypothetical protein R6W73_06745 [Candidatus Saliniplasma sp.]
MIDEKKLLTISVIISLIGTSFLFLYSASQDAEKIEISEIDENLVGAHVETRGFISNLITLEDSYIMELKEDKGNSSVTALVEKRVLSYVSDLEEVRTGTEITARGEVDMYEEDISIIVSRAGDFRIENAAYSSFTSPGELLDNPEWHEGMNHKIRGEILSLQIIADDTILELEPLDGMDCELMIRIEDWDFTENYSISKGSVIVVRGNFGYDSYRGRWCITTESSPEDH